MLKITCYEVFILSALLWLIVWSIDTSGWPNDDYRSSWRLSYFEGRGSSKAATILIAAQLTRRENNYIIKIVKFHISSKKSLLRKASSIQETAITSRGLKESNFLKRILKMILLDQRMVNISFYRKSLYPLDITTYFFFCCWHLLVINWLSYKCFRQFSQWKQFIFYSIQNK